MNKIDFKPSVMLNPVPAVMISSRNKDGKDNIFTVSWINTICTRPPMLSISIRPERLSHDYIKESMEFIVNIPSTDLTYETDFCGVQTGKKIDKIKELNLEMTEGEHVNVAYITACPINIECKVKQIIPLGSHDLFIADVVGSHINDNLMDEKGKIHFEYGNLLNYAHGEYFPMAEMPIARFGYSTKISKKEDTAIINLQKQRNMNSCTIVEEDLAIKASKDYKKNNLEPNTRTKNRKRHNKNNNISTTKNKINSKKKARTR
ncbi:MAG: flavin reductase family protein [Sarcina sp.]